MAPTSRTGRRARGDAGFTMIELVVVLFIVGLLAAIALPSVTNGITRAREAALEQNLAVLRKAIDDYRADRSEWPDSLQVLVESRYVQFVPEDPVAGDEAGWRLVEAEGDGEDGITDVKSTSEKIGMNGVAYSEW